jgi:hypothetical protein
MLNILKNETIWPEYIKLNLCSEFVSTLNNLIEPYKEQVTDAVIYSLVEGKNIRSERRLSYKKSFYSDDIKKLLQQNVIPLIYSMLKSSYPNNLYNVSIGDQTFDYIKYNNGGYFDKHTDFIRIKSSQSKQYTLLIGLGPEIDRETYSWSDNGNTVLWLPIDHTNQYDYEILSQFANLTETSNTNIPQNVKDLCQKYGIGHIYSSDKLKTLFGQNQMNTKYMPHVFNINTKGKSLMFGSNIVHSGEPYYNVNRPKELFTFVINITGIDKVELKQTKLIKCNQIAHEVTYQIAEPKSLKKISIGLECIDDELNEELNEENTNLSTELTTNLSTELNEQLNEWLSDHTLNIITFDQFEYWMINWSKLNNLVPWQIIISKGTYNNKQFADTYIRYCNLDNDLFETTITETTNAEFNILHKIITSFNDIYTKTKTKLNKRGRETHIESKTESTKLDTSSVNNLLNIKFNTNYIESLNKTIDGKQLLFNAKYNILNYASNFTQELTELIREKQIIKYEEKVINTWEESTCNDDGDEYDDTTYLQCNINIKFCFCKLKS